MAEVNNIDVDAMQAQSQDTKSTESPFVTNGNVGGGGFLGSLADSIFQPGVNSALFQGERVAYILAMSLGADN